MKKQNTLGDYIDELEAEVNKHEEIENNAEEIGAPISSVDKNLVDMNACPLSLSLSSGYLCSNTSLSHSSVWKK